LPSGWQQSSALSRRSFGWKGGKTLFPHPSLSHLRQRPKNERLIWMHCASLGEFEQGRPVLEELRAARPGWKVLLTFYSPSGYERCKDEPLRTTSLTYRPTGRAAPKNGSPE